MKAILSFTLPEDREEFELAQYGSRILCVLQELDQKLRNDVKYGQLPESQVELYNGIRDMITQLSDEQDVLALVRP